MGKDKSKKILIIKLGAIGDVVHTLIIPAAIKAKHPDYQVHYLTSIAIDSLISDNPYIDKIHSFDFERKAEFLYICKIIKTLFDEKYDIIISLSKNLRNFFMNIFSFPKKIINKRVFNKSWVENYFYTAKKVIKDIELPERLFLGCDVTLRNELSKEIEQYPKPHIVIIPGDCNRTGRQGRLWSIENWKTLSRLLVEKYGGSVFVSGGPNEIEYHQQLEAEGVHIYTGKHDLRTSSHFYLLADLFISGDTGPLHIASAHGVDCIAILGSTSPDKIKPYGKNGYYIGPKTKCKYCWEKNCKYLTKILSSTPCIESIKAEDVMNLIEEKSLLEKFNQSKA